MAQQTGGTHLRVREDKPRIRDKARGSGFSGKALLTALQGHSVGRRAGRQVLAAALGGLFSLAAIAQGLSPFGVAYAAAAGHPVGGRRWGRSQAICCPRGAGWCTALP